VRPPDDADIRLAGLSLGENHSLLAIYRALAERAYEGVSKVPSMRIYFVNTFLFALIEEDDNNSSKQEELACELELLLQEEEHVNFIDSLAWFHYRRARRLKMQGGEGFVPDLQKAKEYVRRAKRKLRNSRSKHRFYRELLRTRERDLATLDPENQIQEDSSEGDRAQPSPS